MTEYSHTLKKYPGDWGKKENYKLITHMWCWLTA